jgi:hypothetical protein
MSGLSVKSLRESKGDFTNTYYTRFVLPLAGIEVASSKFNSFI